MQCTDALLLMLCSHHPCSSEVSGCTFDLLNKREQKDALIITVSAGKECAVHSSVNVEISEIVISSLVEVAQFLFSPETATKGDYLRSMKHLTAVRMV